MSRNTVFGITFAASLIVDALVISLFSIPAGPLMWTLFGTSFVIAVNTALE